MILVAKDDTGREICCVGIPKVAFKRVKHGKPIQAEVQLPDGHVFTLMIATEKVMQKVQKTLEANLVEKEKLDDSSEEKKENS